MRKTYICEGQISIFDLLAPQKDSKEIAPECKYSGHVCNKENVWAVADTLDDKSASCPHICCRQCRIKGCGARCVHYEMEWTVLKQNGKQKFPPYTTEWIEIECKVYYPKIDKYKYEVYEYKDYTWRSHEKYDYNKGMGEIVAWRVKE